MSEGAASPLATSSIVSDAEGSLSGAEQAAAQINAAAATSLHRLAGV
jgi:hypothetical protein